MDRLHAILRRGREAAKLSQKEAASRIGIKSRKLISNYENGRKPSIRILHRMIEVYALDYTLPELLALKVKPDGLEDTEMALVRAYRRGDMDRIIKIVSDKIYSTDAA